MAYSFRGFGAMRLGKRDFRTDGSDITTLWFVCFHLPVIPIRSERMLPTGEVKYFGTQPRRTYRVLEKTRLHGKQVLSTYAFFGIELAIFIDVATQPTKWMAVPGVLLLGLPWILRKRAMDRVKAEALRRDMGLSPELPEQG